MLFSLSRWFDAILLKLVLYSCSHNTIKKEPGFVQIQIQDQFLFKYILICLLENGKSQFTTVEPPVSGHPWDQAQVSAEVKNAKHLMRGRL